MAWRDTLQTASWRGVEFAVLGTEATAGRRVHVHEYPFRDDPWPEDLGRRTRSLQIKGFLVGDDVADRLQDMQDAAEQEGSGELVHPFRATVDVVLLSLSTSDAWDEGRVVKLSFEFVEAGERRFPSSATDGKAEVGTAASALDTAAGSAAQGGLLATLKGGLSSVQGVFKTVQGYVGTARQLVGSATGALRSVSALAGLTGFGNLGRFLGRSGSGFSLGTVTSLAGGVTSAIGRFNSARNAVSRLGDNVMSLVGKL